MGASHSSSPSAAALPKKELAALQTRIDDLIAKLAQTQTQSRGRPPADASIEDVTRIGNEIVRLMQQQQALVNEDESKEEKEEKEKATTKTDKVEAGEVEAKKPKEEVVEEEVQEPLVDVAVPKNSALGRLNFGHMAERMYHIAGGGKDGLGNIRSVARDIRTAAAATLKYNPNCSTALHTFVNAEAMEAAVRGGRKGVRKWQKLTAGAARKALQASKEVIAGPGGENMSDKDVAKAHSLAKAAQALAERAMQARKIKP